MIRVWLLEDCFGVTVAEQPVVVFTVLNIVNGFYIFAHNVYRGFPREAAIGNLFRSALAIPVSSLYDFILFHLLLLWGIADPHMYLVPSAAVISKMASDTVAAIIEGYADSQMNLRMRRWDYESTIKRIFDCYTQLELLFPREDALICLARPGGLRGRGGEEAQRLERILIICALDLMYFWFYQPRAQEAFRHKVRSMAEADRAVLLSAQLVLMREREVSQLLEAASDELAEYDERFARVEEKLALLPDKQREVFLKCVVEEKKYQEVADELDVSINTIKKHMSRALKFLRDELQDESILLFVLCSR